MTRLHIRPGMDVYSAYQNEYIGTVVRVKMGGGPITAGQGPVETGSSEQAVQGNPELVHEEGGTVSPTRHMPKRQLGEEMGPVPTIALGNTGPTNQSASHRYATAPRHGDIREVQFFAVRPGRINLGFLTAPIWIPASAIRSISMERVVVDWDRERRS